MRTLGMVAWLGLAACAGSGASPDGGRASPADRDGSPWAISVREQTWATSPAGTFTGVWQSCEDAPSPGECSRYVLVQQGDRICGTWSYVASGKSYEGRVVARATSSTEARRTHVCGRPGSETDTECGSGWQHVDKPLLLCNGKLGDLAGANGACIADFEQAPTLRSEWEALQAEPWVRECLSDAP